MTAVEILRDRAALAREQGRVKDARVIEAVATLLDECTSTDGEAFCCYDWHMNYMHAHDPRCPAAALIAAVEEDDERQ